MLYKNELFLHKFIGIDWFLFVIELTRIEYFGFWKHIYFIYIHIRAKMPKKYLTFIFIIRPLKINKLINKTFSKYIIDKVIKAFRV